MEWALLKSNKKLLYWSLSFYLGNTLLIWLIGLKYFPVINWLQNSALSHSEKVLLVLFVSSTYVGHYALLIFLPFFIILPFILLSVPRYIIFILTIVFETLIISGLTSDIISYNLYRYHLNLPLALSLIHTIGKPMLGLSWKESLSSPVIFVCILILEPLYGTLLWHWFQSGKNYFYVGKWIIASLICSLFISYSILFFSIGRTINHLLIESTYFLPFYSVFIKKILPVNRTFDSKSDALTLQLNNLYTVIPTTTMRSLLNFPSHLPHCLLPSHPLNVVVIMIDTWRFDMMNEQVTPAIAHFAKQAWVFKNHFSGANATGPGIFSFFYGVPALFPAEAWFALEQQPISPLLLTTLLNQHYAIKIFASSQLAVPPLYHIIFGKIKNTPTQPQIGKTPFARDQALTQEFVHFLKHIAQTKEPFFSFLLFDGSHSFCETTMNITPFIPAIKTCNRYTLTNESDPLPYLNKYKNALFSVDQQVKIIISSLKKQHLLENTIVIITGDHGEEFNDNHLGYWGHTSNFTHYQTQTPLIIYWPGAKQHIFIHHTSHYDMAPTLLKRVAGCSISPRYYSLGTDLLDMNNPSYLVTTSYLNFGIVGANQIINFLPIGDFFVERLDGQPLLQENADKQMMRQVSLNLKPFYKT